MPHKIRRFSAAKNLGRRQRKRKRINFEKNNPYSLDSRIIKNKVRKDMHLFQKHNRITLPRRTKGFLEIILCKLLLALRYALGICVVIREMELFAEKHNIQCYQVAVVKLGGYAI